VSTELTVRGVQPQTMDEIYRLSEYVVRSQYVQRANPADIALLVLHGQNYGMNVARAISALHVVKGKVIMSAEAMAALIRASSICEKWQWVETTDKIATLRTLRRGDDGPTSYSYTIEQVRKAGLIRGGGNWDKHPAAMLRARVVSGLAKMVYPDIIAGAYTTDEGREIAGEYRQPRQQERPAQSAVNDEQAEEAEVVEEPCLNDYAKPDVATPQTTEGQGAVATMRAAELAETGRRNWYREEKGAPPLSALTDALRRRNIPQAMWDAYIAEQCDECSEPAPTNDADIGSLWRSFPSWRESIQDRVRDRLRWWAQAFGSKWGEYLVTEH